MKTKFLKKDYQLFIAGTLGLIIFLFFYSSLSPLAGLRLKLPKKKIENIANQLTSFLGYDISNYHKDTNFHQDNEQIKYLTARFNNKKAAEIIRKEIPAYYWRIKWEKSENFLQKIKSVTKNKRNKNIDENILSNLSVELSTNGKIIFLLAKLNKNVAVSPLDKVQSLKIAETFLQKVESNLFKNYEFIKHIDDSTHTFVWRNKQLIHGEVEKIEIKTYGQYIVKFDRSYNIPKDFTVKTNLLHFREVAVVFLFLIFFILMVIILVQKLRRDELSLKSGINLSILVGIFIAGKIVLTSYREPFLEVFIQLLLAPFFTSLFLLAIISISESLAREVWPGKLITFDAFNRFTVKFSLFSKSIFMGGALAFLSLGVITILLNIYNEIFGFYYNSQNNDISEYIFISPILFIISSAIVKVSFSEFVFRLFSISYLRKKIKSQLWIIAVAGVLWSLNFTSNNNTDVMPYIFQLINNFIIGVLFAYFFIKYDLMTVFIGGVLFIVTKEFYPLFFVGNNLLFLNGIFFIILLGALFLLAFLGLKRELVEEQLSLYEPPYVHRMKERERIKRELEIARKVQLSLLPRKVPEIPGIEIATQCIPATEVGGDYYDFIHLAPRKLAVVIGDVSGKGIPAAFHVTLTKGFLKAQAKITSSPARLLTQLNELFYENVTRGIFISMIYGVFDLDNKKFTFARAGHNPLIFRSYNKNKVEALCPSGIALGLEPGKLFKKSIQEYTVDLQSGDTFVFFTDGLSEAMDKEKHEFGEKRLMEIISENTNLSANELINLLQRNVEEFVDDATQHDDMTIIVVNIY